MQCNGTEDRWKVAWGILIDGQASLDPAYIRNESLINQFHFCERKSLFLSFSSSSGVQIHLSIVVSHWDWEVSDVTLEGFPTHSLHRQCSQKCIGYEQSNIYCTNKIQSNFQDFSFYQLNCQHYVQGNALQEDRTCVWQMSLQKSWVKYSKILFIHLHVCTPHKPGDRALEISSGRNLSLCQISASLMSNFMSTRNFQNGKMNRLVVKCNMKIIW